MGRYLIWDFDGTLGYRAGGGGWTVTLLDIIRQDAPECPGTADHVRPYLQTGFPWHTPEHPHLDVTTADQWWQALELLFAQVFEALGIESRRVQGLTKRVRPTYLDLASWQLFEETIPTLARLGAQGWTHVILSNHVPELPAILGHLHLTSYIAQLFNSAETGYEKPHPQAFRNVLETIGLGATVWMIGDSLKVDIAGAAAVGIPGILVRRFHPDARDYCEDLSRVEGILNGN